MTRNEDLALAVLMISDARARFREMAQPHATNRVAVNFINGLAQAIGDISPEEAYAALAREFPLPAPPTEKA